MAAARSYQTPLHEVWADAVAHDGGVTQTLTTLIPFAVGESDEVIDTNLVLNTIVGAPVFTLTYGHSAGGFLTVAVANTAAGGNSAMWSLDIRYLHTIIR
jgi:hypothetical protein